MPHSDARILSRFLAKDEKAFEEVFSMFYGQLCYFGEKLVMNRQAAEEIVMDVFIRTFNRDVSFASMMHLRGYLFESVKNHSLNFLKREKRYAKHLSKYFDVIVSNIENYENELVETAALDIIFQAAESLPAECRRIFDMLYKKQMDYKEVAACLQLNIQTVRNQNARAIAHIRKKIGWKGS